MKDEAETRWRRVVVAAPTGSVICGWIPATVPAAVNARLRLHGLCHTVLSADPSVAHIEDHPGLSLPVWQDAAVWVDAEPEPPATVET